MQMIEALYQEMKSMKQDPFKKKILQKLCNAISLLVGFSNAGTCHELIKKQHQLISSGKGEMAFLLFTAQDGQL